MRHAVVVTKHVSLQANRPEPQLGNGKWRHAQSQRPLLRSEIECLSVRRPTNLVYDRETLLNIGTLQGSNIAGIRCHLNILRNHRILADTVPTTTRRKKQQRWGGRKQKRGKRAGIKVRLKANPTRPAVPTILLSNVRSLENKLDELRLLRGSRKVWRITGNTRQMWLGIKQITQGQTED